VLVCCVRSVASPSCRRLLQLAHGRPISNVALFSLFVQYLYTLKVTDQAKADKIAQSFPTSLKKEVL
jgi:hypothetical protein